MPYGDFDTNGYQNPQSVIDLADRSVRDVSLDSTTVTIAVDGTFNLGDQPDTNGVYLFSYEEWTAIFTTDGGTVTVLTLGDAAEWAITKDTATSVNFYITSSELIVQNKTIAEITLQVRRLA